MPHLQFVLQAASSVCSIRIMRLLRCRLACAYRHVLAQSVHVSPRTRCFVVITAAAIDFIQTPPPSLSSPPSPLAPIPHHLQHHQRALSSHSTSSSPTLLLTSAPPPLVNALSACKLACTVAHTPCRRLGRLGSVPQDFCVFSYQQVWNFLSCSKGFTFQILWGLGIVEGIISSI